MTHYKSAGDLMLKVKGNRRRADEARIEKAKHRDDDPMQMYWLAVAHVFESM